MESIFDNTKKRQEKAMSTVFSHIIQKRFSHMYENVATEALAYILESSEDARKGMTKLIRGIIPDMPQLRFRTQQMEGSIRPDMWGFADLEPRLYVENKFWAGLTDNQPVSYLEQLAEYPISTLLLIIAPADREETIWRELKRRLEGAKLTCTVQEPPSGISNLVKTELGPMLALASWTSVLSTLEYETTDDPAARSDLIQLHALCNSADDDAFKPISYSEMSDQRTPASIIQLSSVVKSVAELAVSEGKVCIDNLRPQASWDRIGRYIKLSSDPLGGAGAWFGIHFSLWKAHGTTPLWIVFSRGDFGRAQEVRPLIEPWAVQKGIFTVMNGSDISIALDIPAGEERIEVVRCLAKTLAELSVLLQQLPMQATYAAAPLEDNETARN